MPVARSLGLVFSTTECGIAALGADPAVADADPAVADAHAAVAGAHPAVADAHPAEAYVKLPMRGATEWHGAPGFDLTHVPHLLSELLDQLRTAGWDLSQPGYLSQAWRQHDLVVVDRGGEPLLPALSWQANQGAAQAERLNAVTGLAQAVGAVEPRFVAAKLPWLWAAAAAAGQPLSDRAHRAMLSGDWLAGRLTGKWRLSASDALCNGLLRQADKSLATDELRQADQLLGGGLDPALFPPVIATVMKFVSRIASTFTSSARSSMMVSRCFAYQDVLLMAGFLIALRSTGSVFTIRFSWAVRRSMMVACRKSEPLCRGVWVLALTSRNATAVYNG